VDCIYTRDDDDMYYISPDECIDCAACEPVCPVTAIFAEDATPPQFKPYIAMNYDYFKNTNPADLKRK
jgi:Fe-S-cluster-containing hydrogenase component 2